MKSYKAYTIYGEIVNEQCDSFLVNKYKYRQDFTQYMTDYLSLNCHYRNCQWMETASDTLGMQKNKIGIDILGNDIYSKCPKYNAHIG